MLTEEEMAQWEDHIGKTPQEMVTEYHNLAGLDIGTSFDEASLHLHNLRLNLINEEHNELQDEFDRRNFDKENMLKELADLVYVCYGMAVTYGWNLDEAVRRVHENNTGRMYQDDGTIKRRDDGKILKNKNYPRVNLEDLV